MKKSIYIGLLFVMLSLVAAPALAQVTGIQDPGQAKTLDSWLLVVQKIAKWIYTLVLIVSVFMVLMAAFSYLTAGGDPGKVKKASQMLIYAIVGIVVAILAFSISSIVTGIVG
jgi:membrane-anchored glycerophosphoryl diester phosphodiesterase (GDPDase)